MEQNPNGIINWRDLPCTMNLQVRERWMKERRRGQRRKNTGSSRERREREREDLGMREIKPAGTSRGCRQGERPVSLCLWLKLQCTRTHCICMRPLSVFFLLWPAAAPADHHYSIAASPLPFLVTSISIMASPGPNWLPRQLPDPPFRNKYNTMHENFIFLLQNKFINYYHTKNHNIFFVMTIYAKSVPNPSYSMQQWNKII